ncbi:transcription-repair coupling factor [Wielerella bovis]|uniref:transcription-repair coupling factor n=1 Tax=Wielerella bovis TaxID=2917790 RepID=UPI0020188640|nr:transcription-repair coupling factor [Wielerella bovis]ULJ61922.1 transcription-repair coupling factor [Wielerella bovis]
MNYPIPAASQKSYWTELSNGSLIYLLTQNLPPNSNKLILTADSETAHRLHQAWQFFRPQDNALFFPDWETLPYEHFSPHKDLVSERLSVLWQLKNGGVNALFVPVATAMQKLAPMSFLLARTFWLKIGQTLNIDFLKKNLVEAGYHSVDNVLAAGEFAVRGGIVDVFPMGAELPYRLDLFDNEIEQIKTFDPETQRTLQNINEIRLLPAHEFPTDTDAQKIFRSRFREEIDSDPSTAAVYKAVGNGQFGAGVEYYLPLFFEQDCANLFDYLGENAIVVCTDDVHAHANRFWADVKSRHQLAQGDATYPPLAPPHLFLSPDQFSGCLKPYPQIWTHTSNCHVLPDVAVKRQSEQPLLALADFQTAFDGKILICAESLGRRETMSAFFKQNGLETHIVEDWANFVSGSLKNQLAICVAPLVQGFKLPENLVHQPSVPSPVPNGGGLGLGQNGETTPTPALPRQSGEGEDLWQPENELTQSSSQNQKKSVSGSLKIAVITETELYQYVARPKSRRLKHAKISDTALRDLAEINLGDPVVHQEHGIARYQGLVNMNFGDGDTEMMLLEYANEAQLYVPVSQLHLISRYSGSAAENVSLHKLGTGAWGKAKRKAAEQARDTAAELLNLYAQRAAQTGFKFEINELDYQAFADGFGYEETEDQAAAIAAVLKDLTQSKPMDRLVCGDVGFGKTEVALRAAFVAVMGGKQVAVLAPTTLLVEQHAKNFADRFADFPVKTAALSRFNSTKETKATLAGMADGTVDIVIGTHKLVQDDIAFKNLGLVIIDEEHRFGVRQKEQLKRLRANVDMLTLTATPIPRTLSMALEGLRDFSLMTTAPSRRLAVKTFMKPFGDGSVREAVLRELKRGGQVFFLHNEVDTIENMRDKLAELLPEARIGVAHGQLRERELEQVMREFLQQKFNVLLCSTIIETGIDIPNANTIIINRADKFGIAQLHQLRGRVGRSHHQAYAYLFTPEFVSKDAQKRLDAIAAADELGAGFALAMQDLEIRGAGEILGEGQSGEMAQVGLTLYTEMLKQAVRDLKKGRVPDLDAPLGVSTEIKLHAPALLPESYCPDIHERLVLYKRLATCENINQINEIYEELIDRFGLPETPVNTLVESHRLRVLARDLGIETVDATADALTLGFGKQMVLDPMKIIAIMQREKGWRMAGGDRLRVEIKSADVVARIENVRKVLKLLAE